MNNEYFTAIYNVKGQGELIFSSQIKIIITFETEMISSGILTGTLQSNDEKIVKNWYQKFCIFGKDEKNQTITINDCSIIDYKTESLANELKKISCNFYASELVIMTKKSKPIFEKLILRGGIINLFNTKGIQINTKLGKLRLIHPWDIEKQEKIMQNYKIPLITALSNIEFFNLNSLSLNEIIKKFEETIQQFLLITSLSQLTKHYLAYIQIFDIEEKNELIMAKFYSIYAKSHVSNPITLQDRYNEFINNLFQGYSSNLEDEYGFEFALEWLLDSNISLSFESKYLNATTSLETLMDRYHTNKRTEFLLEKKFFEKKFSPYIKSTVEKFLLDNKYDNITIESVKKKIPELRRRSAVDKAEKLVTELNVNISDIGIGIDEIFKVRNKITHTGNIEPTYELNPEKAYEGLMTLLIRLLLSTLNYKGYYSDPWLDKYIKVNPSIK